jgi:hypothetical protein
MVPCYGLDGPGIESRWWRDFLHPSRWALGPTQPPIQWVPGLSRGWSGWGVALTTHPHVAPRLKNRVELYLYSPCGPLWPLLGWTLLCQCNLSSHIICWSTCIECRLVIWASYKHVHFWVEVHKIMVYDEYYVGIFMCFSNGFHNIRILNRVFGVTLSLYVISRNCKFFVDNSC